jgi:sugar (pentulose or hexulose) kinase
MSSPACGDLLLGIDVGTSLVKAGVFTLDGTGLATGRVRQRVRHPQPDWAEQDPATWWRGVSRAVLFALGKADVPGERVAAVGLSTQGGTLALFDARGRPRSPALVWSDARQHRVADDDPEADEEHFRATGQSSRYMSPAAIAWLRAHRPEYFADPCRIGYVPDYLTFRLTGEWVSDPTNLSISNLLDLTTLDVAGPILARLDMDRGAFARTQPAGQVAGLLLPRAARELGLRAGLPVATPAHDQYAASLGAECTDEGDLLLSAGTAWVLLLTTGRPIIDRRSAFIPGPHVCPGRWGLLGVASAGGSTLDRALVLTGARPAFDRIDAAVARLPAGSDGLLVLPHLLGRTLPTRDPAARGALLGWTLGHTREHLWRAAMEGIALEMRAACDYLRKQGAAIAALRMVGGAARSPVWPCIVASVLGVPVLTQPGGDLAVRGAACLAARALGREDLPEGGSWSEHAPRPEWRETYDDLYGRYGEAVARVEKPDARPT